MQPPEWYNAQEILKVRDLKLLGLVASQAKYHGIPVSIAYSLIYAESNWKIRSKSTNRNGTFDEGLMQLNSANREYFSWKFWKEDREYNAMNPEHNIRIGMSYLRHLYKQFGDWPSTLAAYNCGPTRVLNNDIPLSTRRYVQKILSMSYTLTNQRRISGNARN